LENPKGREHLEDVDLDEKIILEWIVGKEKKRAPTDSSGSGYGPVADTCEHGYEPSGFIKCEEFLY
jgi:hypothetical protein